MEYLIVGKIVDTFSLDGSIKIISSSNNQDIRYKKGNKLYIKVNDEYRCFTIDSYRKSGNLDIVHFFEITTVDEALSFKGKEILAIKDEKDLKEGYFFFADLEGCKVISEGKELGAVIRVEEFPAQVTLRVKALNGKEFFVPFIKVFIKDVDIKNKVIEINYMEGML